jgi:Zn-dependent peptidase ImmA (M78 family)
MLHKKDTINYDVGVGLVLLREAHATAGADVKEVEANRFAAELLMPEASIREDIAKRGNNVDLMSNSVKTHEFIEDLAAKYEVSFSAMQIRLTTLYFS